MWAKRILIGLVVIATVGAGLYLLAWRSAIEPITPADRSAFDPATVAKGAQLAAMGNCASCHTREGGEPYSGGYPLQTPFGTIYGTNITPDPDTGIGRWSEDAFMRAMREGVARDGRHLYPGFPYTYFTRMADEDIRAVYAFLMTRAPVRAETPDNHLPFPFNMRGLLAGWKLLFLDTDRMAPDMARDAKWNRGVYLAESVAHCGACHTPRNALGAEKSDMAYAGGMTAGWDAPALNGDSRAPVPWDADSLFAYLRDGTAEWHGAAAGPMARVTRSLSQVAEADVRAIATYIASVAGEPSAERQERAQKLIAQARQGAAGVAAASAGAERQSGQGAALYAGACASCHDGAPQVALPLTLSRAVSLPQPRNLIHIIRDGIHPPEGEAGPLMPGFAGAFTEDQISELVSYLRSRFSEQPAWQNVQELVAKVDDGQG